MLSPLKRVPVVSSSLRSVGYLEVESVLEAEFRDGAVYRYSAVPPSVWSQLLAAPSKGAFFNLNVRATYPYEKVKAPGTGTLHVELEAVVATMRMPGESS